MGQQQSTQQAASHESLYEILGVERNATATELKKAYRKQALLLHPDRNFNQEDDATARFAKVQAAYDVLSDPQERAWYDSHGSNGGGPQEQEYGGKITTTEELQKYLDPTFYQEIAKNKDEFFASIGKLFDQLKQEEAEAALDLGEYEPILPSFGDADSKFDRAVKPFYDTWSSFSTLKTFAWEDIYRAWDAPDRRTRRAAEQRNKKIREAAKKEFNSAVRQLVNLIKAKDPRVKQNNKQKQKKPGNSAAQDQAKRDREANASKRGVHEEQSWEKVDEEELQEMYNEFGQDDNGDLDLFECVVCDKIFKTKKQLTSHEQSKKHAKAVAQLKREMRREGVELGFDDEISGDDEQSSAKSTNPFQTPVEAFPKAAPVVDEDVEEDNKEENKPSEKPIEKPKTKKRSNQPRIIVESDSESSDDDDQLPQAPPSREKITEDATLDDLLAQLESSRVGNTPTPPANDISVKGKAKKKRSKKAKQVNEFALKCSVCQTEFQSRNKLFDHVKASGHAAPVPRKK